jgi:hypothetical protein
LYLLLEVFAHTFTEEYKKEFIPSKN